MNLPTMLVLPIIAAAIGWFTNYVAIKMLFHPREPVNLLGLRLQGLFPKRKADIAAKLGDIVARDLISTDDLTERLKSTEGLGRVRELLDNSIDEFLQGRFRESLPTLSRLLPSRVLRRFKHLLLDEFMAQLPGLIDRLMDAEAQTIDIRRIVAEKVEAYSSVELEAVLHHILRREFRMLELLGAVLGFLIGCLQLLLVVLF